MNRSTLPIVGALLVCLAWGGFDAAWSRADDADMSTWPPLPQADASVEIPAQEWPLRPGPRKIRVVVHYPSGRLENVGPRTGVMLTLHNWGGVDCVGTADPRTLATRLNVVALCVNYLQSGKEDSIDGPEPYDFGYLQALDALRALAWSCDRLRTVRPSFAEGRLFCTGGSGGGNVSLMAQKLAPRTFACVVDMCGMKKLSDDIAFNLAGGSDLNARYVRDSRHPYFLSIDHQELRFLGNREHLAVQQSYLPTARLVTVHGSQDTTCPYADAVEMAEAMKAERFDVETRFLTSADLDGKIFTSAGHSLGNRTEIVFAVAGKYLSESGKEARERRGPSDFQRREPIVYPTTNGRFVIDYSRGYPVGRFESKSPPPSYKSRTQLLDWIDDEGKPQPVRTQEEWRHRREHIVESFELVAGRRPSPMQRVPLDVRFGPPIRDRNVVRYAVTYQSDREDRVPAWLLVPPSLSDAWEKASRRTSKQMNPSQVCRELPPSSVFIKRRLVARTSRPASREMRR